MRPRSTILVPPAGAIAGVLFMLFQVPLSNASGLAGDLDSTFGVGGFVNPITGTHSVINAITFDNSGRIVTGGYTFVGGIQVFQVGRFSSAGVLDTSFGVNGFATGSPGTGDYIDSITFDSTGRILAGGASTGTGNSNFEIARYSPNGVLDPTFGNHGFTTATPRGYDAIRSISVDALGRIVVGGTTDLTGNTSFALGRFNSNGTLDTSFGTAGFTTDTPGSGDTINSIAIDSLGRIVVGGDVIVSGGSAPGFALGRYTSNGTLYTTFATNGFNTFTPGDDDYLESIKLDSSGRILGGGSANIGGNSYFSLARYNVDGSLDTSFATGGISTGSPGTADQIASIAIDGLGRIVAGGSTSNGGNYSLAVARYSSSGVLDTSFGSNGFSINGFGNSAFINSVGFDAQARILASGNILNGSHYDYLLARYLSSANNTTLVSDPVQQSKIISLSPSEVIAGSHSSLAISGNFVERVTNISVDDNFLPVGSWKQGASDILCTLPPLSPGMHSLQIYNGSSPLLPALPFTSTIAQPMVTVPPAPLPSLSAPTIAPSPSSTSPVPQSTPTPSASIVPSISPPPSKSTIPTSTKIAHVFFSTSSFSVGQGGAQSLISLMHSLAHRRVVSIKIIGHSDSRGFWWNVQLSQFRAKAVASFLRRYGFGPTPVVEGRGVLPTTPLNLGLARRVDLIVKYLPRQSNA